MSRYFDRAGLGISLLIAVLVGAFMWGAVQTERRTEQAVRQNFTAASLLSKLQVEAEKLRRYEKEMFIYVAVADKRTGYVKEFDTTYDKMLVLLDTMLVPSGKAFNDEERVEMLKWKQAAAFYGNEFALLARKADAAVSAAATPEQRAALTVQFNTAIGPGKDRVRELLNGTAKMRTAKEESSAAIASELDAIFNRLQLGALIGGLLVIAIVLLALRSRSVPAAQTVPSLARAR